MGETKSNTGKKDAAKKILFWFGVLFTVIAPFVIGTGFGRAAGYSRQGVGWR